MVQPNKFAHIKNKTSKEKRLTHHLGQDTYTLGILSLNCQIVNTLKSFTIFYRHIAHPYVTVSVSWVHDIFLIKYQIIAQRINITLYHDATGNLHPYKVSSPDIDSLKHRFLQLN